MFHVTLAENIPSILSRGLEPRIGERSTDLGEAVPYVYAFPTAQACQDALMNWLGEWFEEWESRTGKEVNLVILEFDSAGLAQAPQEVAWEARFPGVVPPQVISNIWSEAGFGRWFYESVAA